MESLPTRQQGAEIRLRIGPVLWSASGFCCAKTNNHGRGHGDGVCPFSTGA
ncbi:hypothetical protein K2X85_20560 [bacterium]|nr:hypothetical protein [bacterium]